MQRIRPAMCTWDGEVFRPLPQFRRLCDKQYTVGEEYPLLPVENRSLAQHRGYFASVHEGWMNLGEQWDGRFPSSEALRKWALCKTGYCTETDYVMDSEKDAKQMAAAVRKLDEYAVITVRGNVVKVYQAKSQAMHGANAMRKQEFQDSQRDVLDLIASMARTTRQQLAKEGARHG